MAEILYAEEKHIKFLASKALYSNGIKGSLTEKPYMYRLIFCVYLKSVDHTCLGLERHTPTLTSVMWLAQKAVKDFEATEIL